MIIVLFYLSSQFEPSTGPVQGVTNISVTGINLGESASDLEVTVAGVKCTVHPQHFEASLRLVYNVYYSISLDFFSFQNNHKDLDPSCKMDLDLWDCLGSVKLVL